MNKNKFVSILLVVMISFFCFQIDVYAAQELSCLYEKKGEKNDRDVNKVLLIQDKDGKKYVYKSSEDATFESASKYWKDESTKVFRYAANSSSKLKTLSDVELKECPKSKTTRGWTAVGGVDFYGDEKSGEDQLEDSANEVKVVLSFNNSTPDESATSTVGQSCDSISLEDKWQRTLDTSKYVGSCLYQKRTEYGCHIIELDMSKQQIDIVDSFDGKLLGEAKYSYSSSAKQDTFLPDNICKTSSSLGCPPSITVKQDLVNFSQHGSLGVRRVVAVISYGDESDGDLYTIVNGGVRGTNMCTGEELSTEADVNLEFEKVEILSCDQLFGEDGKLLDMIKTLISIVKIGVPIILLVLGSLDFAQAVFSSSEDGIKKAQGKFIKRIIIAVVIFLIPSVLKFILTLANGIWDNIDADLCGLL